jgi:hypothetical protein
MADFTRFDDSIYWFLNGYEVELPLPRIESFTGYAIKHNFGQTLKFIPPMATYNCSVKLDFSALERLEQESEDAVSFLFLGASISCPHNCGVLDGRLRKVGSYSIDPTCDQGRVGRFERINHSEIFFDQPFNFVVDTVYPSEYMPCLDLRFCNPSEAYVALQDISVMFFFILIDKKCKVASDPIQLREQALKARVSFVVVRRYDPSISWDISVERIQSDERVHIEKIRTSPEFSMYSACVNGPKVPHGPTIGCDIVPDRIQCCEDVLSAKPCYSSFGVGYQLSGEGIAIPLGDYAWSASGPFRMARNVRQKCKVHGEATGWSLLD